MHVCGNGLFFFKSMPGQLYSHVRTQFLNLSDDTFLCLGLFFYLHIFKLGYVLQIPRSTALS
jgi:hypothetical protein